LRGEIRLVGEIAAAPLRVETVHFGGGTPTIIEPDEFVALGEFLRRVFDFIDTAEMAAEIDPRTLSKTRAEALGIAGIRRASLGVQTFDPLCRRPARSCARAEGGSSPIPRCGALR
jgi:oxygen-independent coproporphyrinogen-3 oxidase